MLLQEGGKRCSSRAYVTAEPVKLSDASQSEGGAREPRPFCPSRAIYLAPFQSTLPQIILYPKAEQLYSLGAKRFAGASGS